MEDDKGFGEELKKLIEVEDEFEKKYPLKGIIAYRLRCNGREYRIYTNGIAEGFNEVIEAPEGHGSLIDNRIWALVHHAKLRERGRLARISLAKDCSKADNITNCPSEDTSSTGGADGGSHGCNEKDL